MPPTSYAKLVSMIIPPHRSCWRQRAEKSDRTEPQSDFDGGVGSVATGEDHGGELTATRDALSRGDCIQFSDLLELYTSYGKPTARAVNIRSDDLCSKTSALFTALGGKGVTRGMFTSVTTNRIDHGFDAFARRSALEPILSFRGEAAGL